MFIYFNYLQLLLMNKCFLKDGIKMCGGSYKARRQNSEAKDESRSTTSKVSDKFTNKIFFYYYY